tara:strand:- start:26914 stop:27075 length:162 start_codon:yes stop_codon:yes gene_type:complete
MTDKNRNKNKRRKSGRHRYRSRKNLTRNIGKMVTKFLNIFRKTKKNKRQRGGG